LEALWKHEAEERCAIPTDRAQQGLSREIGKCRKLRKNSRFRVMVHGSFDTTHNLKAAGSHPAPATNNTCKSPPREIGAGFLPSTLSATMPAQSPRLLFAPQRNILASPVLSTELGN
jgi:hypothetical protein